MKARKYKSGTTWCFWHWTEIDSKHITRLHLVKTPWFAVCLHWLHKPDPEPFHHDHPVSFLSVILWGAYSEIRNGKFKFRHYFNYMNASPNDRHTIVAVSPNTLTLAFMGPKVRDWGFHTDKGWVHWKDYYQTRKDS